MAMWQCVLVIPEKIVNGRVREGMSVVVPMNDAARMDKRAEEAVQYKDELLKIAKKAGDKKLEDALNCMIESEAGREAATAANKEVQRVATKRRIKFTS